MWMPKEIRIGFAGSENEWGFKGEEWQIGNRNNTIGDGKTARTKEGPYSCGRCHEKFHNSDVRNEHARNHKQKVT